MAVFSFGLLTFLPSAKLRGLGFISGYCHINIISNLHECCFLILSPGGLAVPCSPSLRAWHQHIPTAQSQGAAVTQTALQTLQRQRAAQVTVKPTTLQRCQLLRWMQSKCRGCLMWTHCCQTWNTVILQVSRWHLCCIIKKLLLPFASLPEFVKQITLSNSINRLLRA